MKSHDPVGQVVAQRNLPSAQSADGQITKDDDLPHRAASAANKGSRC
jgi:hypothetical protein